MDARGKNLIYGILGIMSYTNFGTLKEWHLMSTIREDSIKVLYIHIFLDSVTKLLHIYAKIEGSTYICMCVHLMSYINLHEGSINTHNYDLYFEKKIH